MKKIKVLIVDDHGMIRHGLCHFLKHQHDQYNFFTEEATNGMEAIAKVKRSHYDIVLMDYQMPTLNGAEATRAITSYNPNINILGLSGYNDPMYIKNMLEAGAKGYMVKNIDDDELIKAIEIVLNGGMYISKDVDLKLIADKNDFSKTEEITSEKKLSKRETEVLKLIAAGFKSQQIAATLFINKCTVDKHRQNLLEKMEVHNTAGLLLQAKRLKLID